MIYQFVIPLKYKRLPILLILAVFDCKIGHNALYFIPIRGFFCPSLESGLALWLGLADQHEAGDFVQALSLGLKKLCSFHSHSWDSSHNCHGNEPRLTCQRLGNHMEWSTGISGESTLASWSLANSPADHKCMSKPSHKLWSTGCISDKNV